MAEYSGLWDTNGTGDGSGSGYTEADYAQFFQTLTQGSNKSGVAPDRDNMLAASGASSPVAIATGSAVVHGSFYVNTAPVNVTIPTPSTSTRIDRIVLRKSWSPQTVRITRIAGVEGGSFPAIVESDGTTWDLPLFRVEITTGGTITLTDERQWLNIVPDSGITTAKIADDAVTQAKIAAGAVGTTELANSAATTAKLADANVTTAKVADANITTAKLADGAATTAKIADANVTTAKLADSAVTAAKLASDAVTTAKITDANVTQAKLGADTLRTMLIELGPGSNITDTSTTYITPSLFGGCAYFDKDKLPAGATVKFAVIAFKIGGGSGEIELYNRTDGASVADSEVTVTQSNALAVTISGDIAANLASGLKTYQIRYKRTGGTSISINRAFLLIEW